MSTITTGTKQNNITELNKLSDELYESIFNVNLIENKDKSFYFYNTLEKVIFPEFINTEVFDIKTLDTDTSWTNLSFKIYETISLWWVIFLLNNPTYVFKAKAGRTYKFIKPEYISNVLTRLNSNE
tara:strand:+ start:364 stop:741 length:378 start_codon:yes stop_codon:yes gene_type:complete